MVAEGRAGIVPAVDATLLQQRHHEVGKGRDGVRDIGGEDVEAIRRLLGEPVLDIVGDLLGVADHHCAHAGDPQNQIAIGDRLVAADGAAGQPGDRGEDTLAVGIGRVEDALRHRFVDAGATHINADDVGHRAEVAQPRATAECPIVLLAACLAFGIERDEAVELIVDGDRLLGGRCDDRGEAGEDGAWNPDAASGRALDPDKVHALNHKGQHFTVAGPLDAPRPPQGHPIILHAGTSDRSRELGARDADAIFTSHATIESAQAYYRDIKDRAKKYGRSDADIAILPSLTPIVAPTTAEAVAIYDQLNGYLALDPEDKPEGPGAFGGRGGAKNRNLTTASKSFGVDLLGNDYDALVPASVLAAASEEGKRLFAEITRLTRRTVDGPERITYRDLIIGASRGTSTVVGNPEEVADYIEAWFTEGAADGFNIFPAYVAGAVEAFVDLVVPVLQARDIYRTEYAGPTFRHHLGLARPENRLLARARAAAEQKTAV